MTFYPLDFGKNQTAQTTDITTLIIATATAKKVRIGKLKTVIKYCGIITNKFTLSIKILVLKFCETF